MAKKKWKQVKGKPIWEKGNLQIKTWFGFETGGYDVFRKGKQLNKKTFPSFSKAKYYAKKKEKEVDWFSKMFGLPKKTVRKLKKQGFIVNACGKKKK